MIERTAFQVCLRSFVHHIFDRGLRIWPCDIYSYTSSGWKKETDPESVKEVLMGGSCVYVHEKDKNLAREYSRWDIRYIDGPLPYTDGKSRLFTVEEASNQWGVGERTIRSQLPKTIKEHNGYIPQRVLETWFGALEILPKDRRSFHRWLIKDYRVDGPIFRDFKLEQKHNRKELQQFFDEIVCGRGAGNSLINYSF